MLTILTLSAILSSGASVVDSEINIAANKYCQLQNTTTIGEMFTELTPAVDSILMVPRLVDNQSVREGRMTSDKRFDRYGDDDFEVRELIKIRAGKKCPRKDN